MNMIRIVVEFFLKNIISLIAIIISFFAYKNSKENLNYNKKFDSAQKRTEYLYIVLECQIKLEGIKLLMMDIKRFCDTCSKNSPQEPMLEMMRDIEETIQEFKKYYAICKEKLDTDINAVEYEGFISNAKGWRLRIEGLSSKATLMHKACCESKKLKEN